MLNSAFVCCVIFLVSGEYFASPWMLNKIHKSINHNHFNTCKILSSVVGVWPPRERHHHPRTPQLQEGNFRRLCPELINDQILMSKLCQVRNTTAIFIINLSVSDLLFCCFNLPLAASKFLTRHWIWGPELCQLYPLLRYGLLGVSVFNILAITINRYVMIAHPYIYNRSGPGPPVIGRTHDGRRICSDCGGALCVAMCVCPFVLSKLL